jgi:hypothetical protein
MTFLSKTVLGSVIAGGLLAVSAMSASAAIVCSGNTCWHTRESLRYPQSAGVVIHPDRWHAGPSITFREHPGRGYWSGDRWMEF